MKKIFFVLFLNCLAILSISVEKHSTFANELFGGSLEEVNLLKLNEIEARFGAETEYEVAQADEIFISPKQNGLEEFEILQENEADNGKYNSTSFGRNNYFRNLTAFSPQNNIGSCGYVSLIQTMSYYDTFYNDSVIPEQYDYNNRFALTEAEAKEQSPGVLRQSYNFSTNSSYFQYCHETQNNDLQSRLTVIHNEINDTDNDNTYIDDNGNTQSYFEYSIGAWNYQTMLNRFYGNNSTVKVNTFSNKTQNEYLNLIKETIDSGNPIIVHISKEGSTGLHSEHSVVAYAYDEGGIYANFGWNKNANESLLLGGDEGYTKIYYAATLNYSSLGHSHSNNYVINGKNFCGCNLSDAIYFETPEGSMDAHTHLYWMKNIYDPTETYDLIIRNSNTGANLVSYNVKENELKISRNDWSTIISNCDNTLSFCFKRKSNKVNYNESISKIELIRLSPKDYNFEAEYFFYEKSKTITIGSHNIPTKRLRCGFIEGEYIILSARRDNALTAYLEFSFDKPVKRIDVDLCMWSSNEFINMYNAEAMIQYKNQNNQWVTALDLLKNAVLSKDKSSPNIYSIVFPENTLEIRFYSTSIYGADRNKGRICIGDMVVYMGDE